MKVIPTVEAGDVKRNHVSAEGETYKEAVMAISTSAARRGLVRLIERVNLDRTEVEIVSKRGSAVLMSKDDYDALVETSYLLRSPRNARRLMSVLESVRPVETAKYKP
jgi:antitoxin YefM